MNCCHEETERRARAGGGVVGADASVRALCWCCCRSVRCASRRMLRCGRAGVAMQIATRLRPLLEVVFVVSVVLLIVQWVRRGKRAIRVAS